MGINTERDVEANLQIGPTDQGMVRIFIQAGQVEIPMDFDPEEAEEIARFHLALFNYYYQRWDRALEIIAELNDNMPRKIYDLYIDRIAKIRTEALPQEWDGVFTHTEK